MSVPFGRTDTVDQEKIEALSVELAKHIKSEQDIAALSRPLLKVTVEQALNVELEEHLGYAKQAQEG
jgi:putative transposase